jgi:DNA-binding NarL/FixJ family response regulator
VIRVYIVGASPLVRAGLENLLATNDIAIAGTDVTLDDLAGRLSDVAVDVVLVEHPGDAIEPLLDSLTSSGIVSDFRVMILADDVPVESLTDALRAGVSAVLPGDISPDQLIAALHAASAGLIVLSAEDVRAILPKRSVSRASDDLTEPLTPRESEVLRMLASGLGNKELASRLNISEHTVKFHVTSILGKLGASSRTEAVSIGIRRGLVLL